MTERQIQVANITMPLIQVAVFVSAILGFVWGAAKIDGRVSAIEASHTEIKQKQSKGDAFERDVITSLARIKERLGIYEEDKKP